LIADQFDEGFEHGGLPARSAQGLM
jgi:hypothetical protein